MREFHNYPKWKYKEGEAPRIVQTHSEEAELGDTWYDKPDGTNHTIDLAAAATSAAPPGYEPQEYPKWLYAREYPGGRVVNSEAEELALPDAEWFDKPDFTYHGQDSTDLTQLSPRMSNDASTDAMAAAGVNPPNTTLAPVPEMVQGRARQIAGEETDETRKGENDAVKDAQRRAQSDANDLAGTQHNNFDQASGVNAGDAAPAGDNPNDATGHVTDKGDDAKSKDTAAETKADAAKPKGKRRNADDLL